MDTQDVAWRMAPPGACQPMTGYTWYGKFMLGGTSYAIVLMTVCTVLAYIMYYKRPELKRQAEGHIRQLGSLWVMSAFFLSLGVFIAGNVVNCGSGCSSYASECASISCIVGNFMTAGYVTLALLLLVACFGILGKVNELALQRMSLAGMTGVFTVNREHGLSGVLGFLGEWLIRIGFVLTVITGLVPTPHSYCGLQPAAITAVTGDDCTAQTFSMLHGIGIGGGLTLAIIGVFVRLFAPRKIGDEWKNIELDRLGSDKCVIISLVTISLVGLGFVGIGFLGAYFFGDPGMASEVDFCPNYNTKAACLGQELPSAWYSWAAARKQDESDVWTTLTVDGWQCEWLDNVSTISTGCVRTNCDKNGRLDSHRLAIVCEFLGLIFGIYGIHFSLWATGIIDVTIGTGAIAPEPAVAGAP